MSEATDTGRASAGSLLRAAREKQGLHIAALAAAIKVTPRKLDALEHDRYDELPGATFTRALAQTVCRSLKIDPQPVLALLPQAESAGLDAVAGSLNTPFRDRPGRDEPSGLAVAAIRPMVWAAAVLMLAAVVVYFVPGSFWHAAPAEVAALVQTPAAPASAVVAAAAPATPPTPDAAAQAVDAGSAPAPQVAEVPTLADSAARAASAVATAPAPAASAVSAGAVRLKAEAPSWIEARDAHGQLLLSRVVQPGESVGFDGSLPIRLTIGNAPATTLSFRGKPVDLAASTHDNVARLELQ